MENNSKLQSLDNNSDQQHYDKIKEYLNSKLSAVNISDKNVHAKKIGYFNFWDGSLKAEEQTQQALLRLKTLDSILLNSLNNPIDCWEVIKQPPPLPPKPNAANPVLLEKPKKAKIYRFEMPSYKEEPYSTEFPTFVFNASSQRKLLGIVAAGLLILGVCLAGVLGGEASGYVIGALIVFPVVVLWINDRLEDKLYNNQLNEWKIKLKNHEETYLEYYKKNLEKEYNKALKKNDLKYQNILEQWEKENQKIVSECRLENKKALERWSQEVDSVLKHHELIATLSNQLKKSYLAQEAKAIINYVDLMLTFYHAKLPFLSQWDLEYIPETNTLILDYILPKTEDMPTVKEVKYVKNKDALKEIYLSQTALNKLYDEVIYQVVLATVGILFRADEAGALDAIVFNGWVNSVDNATGNNINACIVSLHVTKMEFSKINLANANPKECFRHLKGVGSSQLHGLTPIPPIMKASTEDRRFIQHYDVAHTLDDSLNIAAMDWEDFEHLVREIFQKILSKDGIEVKVTQSSRDKGVDAIAIDPHPLTGGRIVIQAKRYTNVVGVSAVRDLFGTVMNEGANKGILVTTSNFGSDSYEFAKGKPLTLISGGELLSLLNEYGYKAKIDLKEAKRLLTSS